MVHSEKVLYMRIFLSVLILIFNFQSLSKGDDIRDFQIEGMSIGDSLLLNMSEDEILSLERYDVNSGYKSDKFFDVRTKKMGPYEEILVGLKLNDKSYKIYALAGAVNYENNILDCFDEIEGIEKEFKNLFPNAEISKENNVKHPYDKSGLSTVTSIYFNLKSGSYASLQCFDWNKEIGYWDNLRIGIFSNSYSEWLINEAHK